MKIFFAGNTPNRVKQEKQFIAKGINKRALFSYYFYKIDITMRQVFAFWKTL